MAGKNRMTVYKPSDSKVYPVSATKTTKIDFGDLVWYDETNAVAVSATDFPWQGSEAATQRAFALAFIGVAEDEIPANNKPDGTFLNFPAIRVNKLGSARFPVASGTWKENALVACAKASGNALDPKKVKVVTDPSLAIGKATVNSNGNIQAGVTVGSVAATELSFEFCAQREHLPSVNGLGFFQDPGTGVAIVVPPVGHAKLALNIAGAGETNTLAAGLPGQRLTIMVGVLAGGGSRAITFAADITDVGGENVATFDAASEILEVQAAGDGTWSQVFKKGVAIT